MRTPVPRLARWLVAIAAPSAQRAWLLADLDEEAAARARTAGLDAARRWSWHQAVTSIAPLLAQRIDASRRLRGRRRMRLWRGLPTDIRLSIRRLLHAPGFSIVCVLTLALGIGGNTAVFTLIDRVMLEPLPVPMPSELYRLGDTDDCCVNTGLAGAFSLFSYDLYQHLRDGSGSAFRQLAAFQAHPNPFTIGQQTGDVPPSTLTGLYVSGNYFEMLELAPAAGRLLDTSDDRPGAEPVAVLSHHAWTERYQANPHVAGLPITLNGVPATIVGVAPQGFYGEMLRPDPPDLWVPLSNEPRLQPQARLLDSKPSHWLYVIGRLRPGASIGAAQARATATLQQWIAATLDLPASERAKIPRQHIDIVPAAGGVGNMRHQVAPTLKLLLAIAAAVLLIACGNLANLLLARGLGQRTEMAVRVALGAPRSRLVAQFLADSLLLAIAGGLGGLLISYAGARAIVQLAFRGATNIPVDPSPSWLVLAFAMGLSLLTGAIFGAGPALLGSRSDPIDAMRGAGRGTTDRGSRLRRSLIALQVALSLVLITCAGLLGRSLGALQHQDFGFRIDHRYVASLSVSLGRPSLEELQVIYGRISERLAQIPGVASTSLSLYSPMSGDNWESLITVDGHDPSEALDASWDRISAGYFETIGTPVLRGRAIDARDRPGAPLVAVVSQGFARKFFGDADPIGRHIGFSDGLGAGLREFDIVGLVGDAKYQDAKGPAYPTFFLPLLQTSAGSRLGTLGGGGGLDRSHYAKALELRATAPVPNLDATIRQALLEVDRRITVRSVSTLDEQVARNFNTERLIARLTVAFGGIALLLACLGLYGVTAYTVTRQTREIGIRVAIGASRAAMMATVLRRALAQVAVGLAVGLPAALVAGRLLRAELYGVSGHDPVVLIGALVVLVACAVAAALIPAHRAASLDPVRALRSD